MNCLLGIYDLKPFSKMYWHIITKRRKRLPKGFWYENSFIVWRISNLIGQDLLIKLKYCRSDILSGVPQGFRLCPLLFILYTTDLPKVLPISEIQLYEDDKQLVNYFKSCLYSEASEVIIYLLMPLKLLLILDTLIK